MEDERIVELFLSRDEAAISESAAKYGAKLRRIAESITGDAETAGECENDTYLKAWNRIPPDEPRTYLFPYLARIARFTAVNRLKEALSQKRNADFVELTAELECCIPAPQDVESAVDAAELSRAVSTFLRGIAEEKRNVFIRRYWYAESVRDIAAFFRMSEAKVKSLLFRTRNELKAYLEKEGYSDL